MRWGFAAALHPNGYIIFPSWLGGLIIQWTNGEIPEGTVKTRINLPIAFPEANFGASVLTSSEIGIVINSPNHSRTGADLQARSISSSALAAPDAKVWYRFICIGK
jgi:hypothetical protein